jgi:hypothetical protein
LAVEALNETAIRCRIDTGEPFVVIRTHLDGWSVPLDIAKFGQLLLNGGKFWETVRDGIERLAPAKPAP